MNTFNNNAMQMVNNSNINGVMEIWKDIKGYEGLYMVSSLGRVKSLNYRGQKGIEHILSITYSHKRRQSTINLYRDGVMHTVCVNRLVAEIFIPSVNLNYDIIHKDGNYKNNSVANLQVSPKKHGLRNQIVFCLDKSTEEVIDIFQNQVKAARAFNVTPSAINHYIHKMCKTSAKRIWKYAA